MQQLHRAYAGTKLRIIPQKPVILSEKSYNFAENFLIKRKRAILMARKREIRNSTAEFLIFQAENKEQGIEVMYADETIWCTQKALFDVGVPAISKHLANVFETGELKEEGKKSVNGSMALISHG